MCSLTSPFRVSPGPLAPAFERACARLDDINFADALWTKRLEVWTADPSTRQKIANRLGWLNAISVVTSLLPRLRELAESIRAEGRSDIVLLGMGGSSLAPEVLREVIGVAPGYPRFRMLDSVDPEAVRDVMAHAASSLFILASKSGSTIEPNVMAAEARQRLIASGEARWASRFLAITDDGTSLHQRASSEGFREIFVNPADIGGRYSALSLFGMVPAALMGVDLERLLSQAREMEAACRVTGAAANPGLALGAFLAAGAESGRDKLTLVVPPRLASFGLWVEQLIAESTGKQGKGVVPITGEDGVPGGADRVVVVMKLAGDDVGPRFSAGDTPLFELTVPDEYSIGAEFLRWEVATAAAGVLMGINPFDEPNVQQAKDATRALLDTYKSSGSLPAREPHATIDGARLTLSAAAEQELRGDAADRFLSLLRAGDYCGLLAYLPPDREPFHDALQAFRMSIRSVSGCATMFGYGPRYLHSTGQLHKGGANNGVFLIVTASVGEDLPIDGEPFSFGVLEMAQALGDFESLDRAGRRALHVHLPRRDGDLMGRVFARLTSGG